jgi:spoIIIJ-associated protein
MDDLAQAAQTIGRFLQNFASNSGLRLRFRVKVRGAASGEEANGELPPEANNPQRTLYVEFSGPDTQVLTAHNGELLNALEHIAIKILRLEPDQLERVSFDADNFKANRDRRMRDSAAEAVEQVRATGRPHPFPAMNSRDRRALHLLLKDSGLPTASSGEGSGRFVVLYPEDADIAAAADPPRPRPDAARIRETFRHR